MTFIRYRPGVGGRFAQPGAPGGIERSIASKLRDIVSVRDFGAAGDGSTNDTSAIQAALDSLSPAGTLMFPAGIYPITTTLTIPQDNVLILVGSATISMSTAITGLTVDGDGVWIEGGRIVGPGGSYLANSTGIHINGIVNGAGVAPTRVSGTRIRNVSIEQVGDYGIKAWYADRVDIDGCHLDDIGYFAVSVLSTNNSRVHNCKIRNVAGAAATSWNAYGIALSSIDDADDTRYPACSDVDVDSNYVFNIPEWHGIMAKGGSFIRFTNNNVVNCRRGIMFSFSGSTGQIPTTDSVIADNRITNYLPIDDGSIGESQQSEAIWDIGFSSSVQNQRNRIENNVVYHHGGADASTGAVFIENTADGVCARNSLVEPFRAGVVVTQGVDNYVIDGNEIIDPQGGGTGETPAQTGNTQFGIWFRDSNFDNIKVTRNSIIRRNASVNTFVADYGVHIPDTASKSIHFEGNVFVDMASGNFSIAGDQTGLTGDIDFDFTGTLTGFGTPPSGTVRARVRGLMVHLKIPELSGTSNATTMTMTGLPPWLMPASDQFCVMSGQDSGTSTAVVARIDSGAQTITFFRTHALSAWTASGTKGVWNSSIAYSLA